MLANKGLHVVEDLLMYAPFRYEDRSNVKPISELAPGEMATVMAEVRSASVSGFRRKNLGMFQAVFTDSSRARLVGKWFHGAYLEDVLRPGLRVALYGKIEFDNYTGDLSVLHPEFEIISSDEDAEAALHVGRIVPIYEAAGKVTTRVLRDVIWRVLESLERLPDPMPETVRNKLKLPSRDEAIRGLHFPAQGEDLRLLNASRSPAQ